MRLSDPVSLGTPDGHTKSRPPSPFLSPGGRLSSAATEGIRRGNDRVTERQAPLVSLESNISFSSIPQQT